MNVLVFFLGIGCVLFSSASALFGHSSLKSLMFLMWNKGIGPPQGTVYYMENLYCPAARILQRRSQDAEDQGSFNSSVLAVYREEIHRFGRFEGSRTVCWMFNPLAHLGATGERCQECSDKLRRVSQHGLCCNAARHTKGRVDVSLLVLLAIRTIRHILT